MRLCAQQQGVSPSTVVAACDQLLAQGLVEARRNRGFFVREMALAPESIAQPAINSIAESNAQSASCAVMPSVFAPGWIWPVPVA